MICSGVCRRRFMVVLSSFPTSWGSDSHNRWISSGGPGHPGINGLYRRPEPRISLARHLPLRHRAKTLAHELGHVVLHADTQLPRGIVEFEAESAAFVVCHALGIDSSDYTFGYLLHWTGGSEPALDALATSGERIRQDAATILDIVHKLFTHTVDRESTRRLNSPYCRRIRACRGDSCQLGALQEAWHWETRRTI